MTFNTLPSSDFTTNAVLYSNAMNNNTHSSQSSSSNIDGVTNGRSKSTTELGGDRNGNQHQTNNIMNGNMMLSDTYVSRNNAFQQQTTSSAASSNQFQPISVFSLPTPQNLPRNITYPIANSTLNSSYLLNQRLNLSGVNTSMLHLPQQDIDTSVMSVSYPYSQQNISAFGNLSSNSNPFLNPNVMSLPNLNYSAISLNNNSNNLSNPSLSATLAQLQELTALNSLLQQQPQPLGSFLNNPNILNNTLNHHTSVASSDSSDSRESSVTALRNAAKRALSEHSNSGTPIPNKRSRIAIPEDVPSETSISSKTSFSNISLPFLIDSGTSSLNSTTPSLNSNSSDVSTGADISSSSPSVEGDSNRVRKKHITTDRQRRAKIKDGMHQLRDLLLTQGSFTSDQVSIMTASVQLIKRMKSEVGELRGEVKSYKQQLFEYQQRYGLLPPSASTSSSNSSRKTHRHSSKSDKLRSSKGLSSKPMVDGQEKSESSVESQNDSNESRDDTSESSPSLSPEGNTSRTDDPPSSSADSEPSASSSHPSLVEGSSISSNSPFDSSTSN